MKKIICTLIVLVGFATVGFSQDRTNVSVSEGVEQLMESKTTGKYTFTLPSNVTSEEVNKRASYYTNTMSVTFDNNSKKAELTMVDSSPQARNVIARFLSACGTKEIQVGDSYLSVNEFIDQYLK